MTEQTLLPPPDEAPEPFAQAPKNPQRNLVPWLYGLGFLVLAAAIFYLWQYPSMPNEPVPDVSAIQAAQQQIAAIDARLTRLEQRPPPDLGKITARVDAIDGRVVDQTHLASQVDTLSGRIQSLSSRDQTALDGTRQQLQTLASRVAAVASDAGDLDAVTKRLDLLARVQQASIALAEGQPLGDLPNAPEPLSRFAHAAPPTEAQLRLLFPRDEQAALAAKQPEVSSAPFVSRVWDRAQGLITIRRGDNVVVGDPSATILNHARAALDAGDIAGAATFVESLRGPPAQAMADWLKNARALLDARSALAAMADKA
ncbi:COG4223 family protein [Rhodopila sp.]|uniref:COG4223 family protein n=1 Tax=Rhodopila sp. TaxID=2480087 RepID=UPI003D11DF85